MPVFVMVLGDGRGNLMCMSSTGLPPWHIDPPATRVLMLTDNVRLRDTLTRGLNRHKFEVLASAASQVDKPIDLAELAAELARLGGRER